MLKRILIANRGEIARRIARTCDRLGVEYVTVYSDADRGAAHLADAVATVHLGGSPAADSYLHVQRLVDAALRTGCDAVHPGYGFLSESPRFAAAVTAAGLIFIGPDADTIAAMGDKATARALMAAAGVPVLPGSGRATESVDQITADAARIGYPVILKPVAGGGGKGMHVVETEPELVVAVAEAVRLARGSFGDGRLLVERYLARPRHIEVQVFGDQHGAVVHLFERECSLQRRHQKIIEEAPAPRLPQEVRAALLSAAVRGARALRYSGAGTFEFILDPAGEFFFLEVNTRLQVEHPVTEAITGVDLVEWQLRVADGQPLPVTQDDIVATGHAVECRVYAEDPEDGFRPAPGKAVAVRWPATVRVESAFDDAGAVPTFYDPMIAKLVAEGHNRATALRRLDEAVRDTSIFGLTTNLGFLGDLLRHERVTAGDMDTHLVDDLVLGAAPRDRAAAVACAAAMSVPKAAGPAASPWTGTIGPLDRGALNAGAPLGRIVVRDGDRTRQAALLALSGGRVLADADGTRFSVSAFEHDGVFDGTVGASRWTGLRTPTGYDVLVDGYRTLLTRPVTGPAAAVDADDLVRSPLPGTVVGVNVAAGDRCRAGDVLITVEAMKMENPLRAPFAGSVGELRCSVGDAVTAGQVLAIVIPSTPDN